MNKQVTAKIKTIPYYGRITRKYRFKNSVKDKAWAILSDYVRMRDFITYGTCISSGRRIYDWRESDAGHYESMAGHGALVGFSDLNVHMQSKNDNQLSSMATGAKYRDELISRYGEGIIAKITRMKNSTVKADDWFFIERIEDVNRMFMALAEMHPSHDFPEYVNYQLKLEKL